MVSADSEEQRNGYVTVAEAARLLRFPVRTIRRWANAGRLPCIVVAGQKRIAVKDLEAVVTQLRDPDT